MAHPRAKLTEFGRQLVVDRVIVLGWSAAQAAAATGVSRATVYKWLRRFKAEGGAGLADRSSRPHRCPHALPEGETADPASPTPVEAGTAPLGAPVAAGAFNHL